MSEFTNGRESKISFCVFLCVCVQRTMCAWWMVKDPHCMLLINTHSPTLCARWVEESSVTLSVHRYGLTVMTAAIQMWFDSSGDRDRSFFCVDFKIMRFWNLILALIGADMECGMVWRGLWFGMVWYGMGSKLDWNKTELHFCWIFGITCEGA